MTYCLKFFVPKSNCLSTHPLCNGENYVFIALVVLRKKTIKLRGPVREWAFLVSGLGRLKFVGAMKKIVAN